MKNEINSNRFYPKLVLLFSMLGIVLVISIFKYITRTANFVFISTEIDYNYYMFVSRTEFLMIFSIFGPISLFRYWKQRFKPPENLSSESPIPTLILIFYVILVFVCYFLSESGLNFSGLILTVVLYQIYILFIPFLSKTNFVPKAYIYIGLSLILSLFPMFIWNFSLSVPIFLIGQFYSFKSFVLLTLVFIFSFFPLHRKKRSEKLEKISLVMLLVFFNIYLDISAFKQVNYHKALLSRIYLTIFCTEIILLIFSIITIYWSNKIAKQT